MENKRLTNIIPGIVNKTSEPRVVLIHHEPEPISVMSSVFLKYPFGKLNKIINPITKKEVEDLQRRTLKDGSILVDIPNHLIPLVIELIMAGDNIMEHFDDRVIVKK